MKHKFAIITGAIICNAYACSSFFVPIHDSITGNITNVINERTLDFENSLPTPVLYGAIGDNNVSSVNVDSSARNNAASWTNTYQFIGKSLSLNELLEGVNSAGLYMGALYLPDITQYPQYNPNNSKPALGVFDIINYVLGTSSNVNDAIANLQKVQVVIATVRLSTPVDNLYQKIYPLHYHLVDKSGNSAVIEFINGQMQVTQQNGQTFPANLRVMTNSPNIAWQQNNYSTLSQNWKSGNTTQQWDNMYMNGSGYFGMPGDTTPNSRYVKINTILNAQPKAYTVAQAQYNANAALWGGAIVSVGMNGAPSFWSSSSNLGTGDYIVTDYLEAGDAGYIVPKSQAESGYINPYNVNNISGFSSTAHAVLSQASSLDVISYTDSAQYIPGPTESTGTYTVKYPLAQ